MINRIKTLILGGAAADDGAGSGEEADDLQVAAVALLVEAAVMDGDFGDAERQIIAALIADRFGLGDDAVQELIATGEEAVARSHQLYAFTSVIKQGFEVEDRVVMIEMLWDVACADGEIHDYEANLVRRVAGLIHVPDRASGEARKRAMQRQNMDR
ncbi:MAG: TerB family tellurite resistance protein [Rhodospirillales bacterium]|nr:TerB family tellurite resistance protein [Rhodospirillales bacterium]